jgi:hypothetical protein
LRIETAEKNFDKVGELRSMGSTVTDFDIHDPMRRS